MERYGKMRWCDDLDPARWLEQSLAGRGGDGSVAAMTVPGFPAYARILHPAWCRTPEGAWLSRTWSEIAAVSGVAMWPTASFDAIADSNGTTGSGYPYLWTYRPFGGGPPVEVAHHLVAILARHTETTDNCWFGLWEGHESIRDQTSDQAPCFGLPGRRYLLLRGALASVLSAEPLPALPDRWWPEDRAWCLGGDADLDSTCIGGSRQLIADLVDSGDVEAYAVGATDRL